jgi:hypothetical protein
VPSHCVWRSFITSGRKRGWFTVVATEMMVGSSEMFVCRRAVSVATLRLRWPERSLLIPAAHHPAPQHSPRSFSPACILGWKKPHCATEAQATEIAIAVEVLNRLLELGRPNSVRVA